MTCYQMFLYGKWHQWGGGAQSGQIMSAQYIIKLSNWQTKQTKPDNYVFDETV